MVEAYAERSKLFLMRFLPLTSPFVLAQTFSIFLLAFIYTTQITFTWVREYTSIDHPLWWVAGPIVALMIYVLLKEQSRKTLTLRLTLPDAFFGFFILYLYFKIIFHHAELHHVIAATTVAGFYIMGRIAGHYGAKLFLNSLLSLSYITLMAFVPFMLYMATETSQMERFTFNIGLVAPHWPGSIIGALAVAAFAYALIANHGRAPYFFALLAGLLSWVLIYIGARSLVMAVGLVFILLTLSIKIQPLRIRLPLLIITFLTAIPSFFMLPDIRAEFFKQLPESVVVWNNSGLDQQVIVNETGACKSKGNSIALRAVLYEEALDLILKHPLGIGAGKFSQNSCVYGYHEGLGDPHSVILHIAAELGLPALIFFLLFVGWLCRTSLKELKVGTKNSALLIVPAQIFAIWAYHFFNDQVTSSYVSAYQFYIISGVLTSCLLQIKKDS